MFEISVMESSHLVGAAEECSSSESGWTMYLSSPMHTQTLTEEEEDGEEEDQPTSEEGGDNGGAAEDGDSVASDASSGPPNRRLADLNSSLNGSPGEENHEKEKLSWRRSLKNKEKNIEEQGEDGEGIHEDVKKK